MNAFHAYFEEVTELLKKAAGQEEALETAARICHEALENGKMIYTFGTGHSHMLAEEIFYRAGGLVRVNPILDEGLMLHAGAAKSTSLERLDHYGEVLADHYGLEGGSVMLIFSNSGRNAATIEMAHAAHERGLSVIAITNLMHSRSVESRHSSGKKLYEVADVVLDNYGCVGDAAIDVGTYRVGPTSTVVGAALLQALVCRIVELSLEDDRPIEVFCSSNVDSGDHRNAVYIQKYREKIRALW